MGGGLHAAPRFLLDLLFPGRCLLCGEWLLLASTAGALVCDECIARLRPLGGVRCRVCSTPLVSEDGICTRCRQTAYAFDSNFSIFAYETEVRRLIACYKFDGRSRLADLFAGFLAPSLRESFAGMPVIPVPPRPHAGGIDHVERIARAIERSRLAQVLRPLERTGGASQKSLDFEQRRGNLQGKIRKSPGARVPERAVVLDDVFTTGATADACARVLLDAGCRSVSVLTLALDM